MAGPLSSEEIEDVVSSVRRLVSNEQSPRRVTRDLNADRLLLTPALRVVSQIDPLATLILDTRLPDLAPDAPVLEEMPAASAEPDILNAPADVPFGGPEIQLIEADWEDELWATSEPASLGEVALGAEEAEILIAPADDTEIKAAAMHEDGTDSWAQGGSDWVDDDAVPFIPLRRRAESLAARVASGEVLAGSPAEPAGAGMPGADTEDDGPFHDLELAALEMTAAELAAFEIDPEIGGPDRTDDTARVGRTQRMPTEILDADGIPLAVLDEAALQDIVRQMIREELQGSLGERITRNVRKLVRAEINRALVARDLD